MYMESRVMLEGAVSGLLNGRRYIIEQCVSTSCNMEHLLALSTYVSPRQDAHNSRCAKLSSQDSRLLGSTYQQCMSQRI